MSQFQTISTTSLCLASVLVIISMLMSYRQELKLEKDFLVCYNCRCKYYFNDSTFNGRAYLYCLSSDSCWWYGH